MSVSGLDASRHEVKFVLPASALPMVERHFKLHPERFRAAFPPRWINNVYFDTFEFDAYADNVSGASRREKVRYRWYGLQRGPGPGVLEVKRRRNVYGWKESFPVRRGPFSPKSTWRQVRQNIRSQIPLEGRLWLDGAPQPVIVNRYRRTYFVSGDQRVRVTIDTDLQVFDQRRSSIPRLDHPMPAEDELIVEFKCAREDRRRANITIQGLPSRVGRNSKYVRAVEALSEF